MPCKEYSRIAVSGDVLSVPYSIVGKMNKGVLVFNQTWFFGYGLPRTLGEGGDNPGLTIYYLQVAHFEPNLRGYLNTFPSNETFHNFCVDGLRLVVVDLCNWKI